LTPRIRTYGFAAHARGEAYIFRKIPPMRDEIQPKRYTALQVKCPSLLTTRNQTFNIFNVRLGSARKDFSRKSFQWKQTYSRKCT